MTDQGAQEAAPFAARALAYVAAHSVGPSLDATLRITLHFHPDRFHQGEPVLARIAREGVYRSQFETGTSNGGQTAFVGGDRWCWESRIFGGAYDDAPASARPRYGALNHRLRPTGASPRFGSSFFRLRHDVLARSTFCYPDSVFAPTNFGVAARCSLIELANNDDRDRLDDYIEAHVHGSIDIRGDVEALVLDPSFRHTDVERAAATLECPLEWHPGFSLRREDAHLYVAYRGADIAAFAAQCAEGGVLTPASLGRAAPTTCRDPQAKKKAWHLLARFGDQSLW